MYDTASTRLSCHRMVRTHTDADRAARSTQTLTGHTGNAIAWVRSGCALCWRGLALTSPKEVQMLQRRLMLACVFVLAVALPMHAQQLRQAKAPEDVGLSSERLRRLSTAMQAAVDKGELPGVAVVIARQGQVAFGESFGFRDREAGTPMALDSIHRIASMTKPITSLAAMMLVEEGRIGLADPVSLNLLQSRG